MTTNNVELQPAITTFYKRLKAFLECDSDIEVTMNYEKKVIYVMVHDLIKAVAWRQILPRKKKYGNIEFSINVDSDVTGVDDNVFLTAMRDNPKFASLFTSEAGYIYCYLKPEIIQFENDNLGSPDMLETWTAEDLAKEVIQLPLINYCTEPIEKWVDSEPF